MFEKPMITLYNELEVDGSAHDGDSELRNGGLYNIPYDKGGCYHNRKRYPPFLPEASTFKPTESDVNAGMIFEPYPPRLALCEDPVPEFLYGEVWLADTKHRRLNTEVAHVLEGRKCLVAEERGHLFEKWKECRATIACKVHAKCVLYACVDVSYGDEFHTWVMR